MLKNMSIILLTLLFSGYVYADSKVNIPIDEFEFVEEFSGKDKDYIVGKIGKPYKEDSRENEGGKVVFMTYKNIVTIGKTDKVYKYTQIGIVNGAVETIGNTNLESD